MYDLVFSLVKENGGIEKIAESADSPADFIKAIMKLRGISVRQAAEIIGIDSRQLTVLLSYAQSGKQCASTRTQYKIAKGLDVDPYLMAKVWSEWDMKRIIKKESNGN